MATKQAAIVIEQETVTRDYGFRGTIAIVEKDGTRYLIEDGYGGESGLEGGAVRWRHGLAARIQPGDTIESLKAARWNIEMSLFAAVTEGCDDTRPLLPNSPEGLAKAAGLI